MLQLAGNLNEVIGQMRQTSGSLRTATSKIIEGTGDLGNAAQDFEWSD